jgi:transcriptional regulator with XRE-family HTH domain
MKMTGKLTDEAILSELGERLTQARLAKNLTQAQLATQAGISKRTIERLESGELATQLSAFIRVCRVLDLVEHFESLVPEITPSPIAQLKSRGRIRRRASAAPAVGESPAPYHSPANPPAPWTWK